MKRRWNIPIWAGFAIVIAALATYIPIFVPFPVTRDVPWANYLLFLAGGLLLAVGLRRAFRDPEHWRGKTERAPVGLVPREHSLLHETNPCRRERATSGPDCAAVYAPGHEWETGVLV